MKLKLKAFREEYMEMGLEEFSKLVKIDKKTIQNYEKNPESLPEDVSNQIIEATGEDAMDIYTEGYAYKEIKYKAWEINSFKEKEIIQNNINYYNTLLKRLKNKKLTIPDSFIVRDNYEVKINLITEMLNKIKKPSVTLFGASSAGKSTMINHILGDNLLPANFSRTTSAVTKIVHVEDKPEYMGEDSIAIFKTLDGESDAIETHKLFDEEYFNSHLLETGNFDLIEKYGKYEEEKNKKIQNFGLVERNRKQKVVKVQKEDLDIERTIVCYVEAPILHLCNIWDVPGTKVNEKDSQIAKNVLAKADITLYLSKATQFLQADDQAEIKELMQKSSDFVNRYKKTDLFENIFIIASQAGEVNNSVNTNQSVEEIIEDRLADFYDTLERKYFTEKEIGFNFETLQNRTFAFDVKLTRKQKKVKDNLVSLLEKVTKNRIDICDKYKKTNFKKYNELIIEKQNGFKEQQKAKEDLEKFLKEKPGNQKKIEN